MMTNLNNKINGQQGECTHVRIMQNSTLFVYLQKSTIFQNFLHSMTFWNEDGPKSHYSFVDLLSYSTEVILQFQNLGHSSEGSS